MYSEMHGSWLSCLQSREGCWVPVSGPSFPGNWMCPTIAATQTAAQVQRPMVARSKGIWSLICTPYAAALSERKTWEHTEGRGKGFAPPGTLLLDVVSKNGRERSKQLSASSGGQWLCFLIQRRKKHEPNSSGISIHKSILHWTRRRSASHDRPDRFWYRRSQKCVLRFSAHATIMTHLLSLQDDRDSLASPEQTSDITSMMHTFIGIIVFLN